MNDFGNFLFSYIALNISPMLCLQKQSKITALWPEKKSNQAKKIDGIAVWNGVIWKYKKREKSLSAICLCKGLWVFMYMENNGFTTIPTAEKDVCS